MIKKVWGTVKDAKNTIQYKKIVIETKHNLVVTTDRYKLHRSKFNGCLCTDPDIYGLALHIPAQQQDLIFFQADWVQWQLTYSFITRYSVYRDKLMKLLGLCSPTLTKFWIEVTKLKIFRYFYNGLIST